MKFKPDNINPQGRPKVYFCCHPNDFDNYFELISNEILEKQKCTIWYAENEDERNDEYLSNLKEFQLFVMPVTTNLLCTENVALDVEFNFAIENHIPVLPLLQEPGLENLFNQKCGDLQFLDKQNTDITAISYSDKLDKYLSSVLIGDELAEKIRAAFDAYVFLSYRKKDRKYAQELMRLIHKNEFCRDIAIWYDEFLTPGENFNDSIIHAIQKSGLFVLTVTPNLVNEKNYVMNEEYPLAQKEGKIILPAEMVETNKKDLISSFKDIPECINARNEDEFSDTLLRSIKEIAIKENKKTPEHNFFIGLAYLNGIDVEVDRDKALNLIKGSAEENMIEAIRQLVQMYYTGIAVERDFQQASYWQKKKVALLEKFISESQECNNKEIFELIEAIILLAELLTDGVGGVASNEEILQTCIKAKELSENIIPTDTYELSKMLDLRLDATRRLAIAYESNNLYEEAKKYYYSIIRDRETLARYDLEMKDEKLDVFNKYTIARSYHDIGVVNIKNKEFSSAIESIDIAMKMYKELSKYDDYYLQKVAEMRTLISRPLCELKQFNEAIEMAFNGVETLRTLYEKNNSLYEILYATSILEYAIVLSTIDKNKEELEDLYKTGIKILKKHIKENVYKVAFDYVVATYKLANWYIRNNKDEEAKNNFVECISASCALENCTDEITMSQLAVIYLDYGTWCYANSNFKNLDLAIDFLNKAKKVYLKLSEIDNKYLDFLEEIEQKNSIIATMQSNKNADAIALSQIFIRNLLDGEYNENHSNYCEAYNCYKTAETSLSKIEDVNLIPDFCLTRADLFDRIALCCENINKLEEAYDYYTAALSVATEDFYTNKNFDALTPMVGYLEKLCGFCEDYVDINLANNHYKLLFNLREKMLEQNDAESWDKYAFASYKVYLTSPNKKNKTHLKRACKIWKSLYKDTGIELYKKKYNEAKKINLY